MPDGRHGYQEDDKVGDDVHDRREVPDRQCSDALSDQARKEDGGGDTSVSDEELLSEPPGAEEYEKNQTGPLCELVLEDAAVL